MRVALVTETWLPSTDGVVTRLTATARELVRLGHQVLVIAPRGADVYRRDVRFPGVTVRTVPTVGLRFIYGGQRWGLPSARVGRFLRQFSPDVVHVVNPTLLGIAGVVAARRQRRPLVASHHTDLTQHAVHYHLSWARPIIWALLQALHRRAALSLATSAAACASLKTHGITDVQLWPRGVDVDLFHPDQGATTSHRPGRPVALYVGRLAGEKGLHRLAPLAAPDSGFELMLVGDGPQRHELERRFSSSTVQFTGTLHGEALAAAYRHADVFVFPSTTETLGLVLLEALASGLPIIAADSPATRELLTDCPTARLFPPDQPEQILTIAHQLRRNNGEARLAAAALRQTDAGGWQNATTTLLEYYQQAMSAPHTEPNAPLAASRPSPRLHLAPVPAAK